jgi:anthranilate synthase
MSAPANTLPTIDIHRTHTAIPYPPDLTVLTQALNTRRGALFVGATDAPPRHQPKRLGFIDPPLAVIARHSSLFLEPLNARGQLVARALADALRAAAAQGLTVTTLPQDGGFRVDIDRSTAHDPGEESRTRRPSLFTALRVILAALHVADDGDLGLYGALGYDLAFELEDVPRTHVRPETQRDLVLYLPDALIAVDDRTGEARHISYDFTTAYGSTHSLPREGAELPLPAVVYPAATGDHDPGAYADVVRKALVAFERGDLFEVVPGQTFTRPATRPPAALFTELMAINPAPHGALINLGGGEHLVVASPEMFVKVSGRSVETSPISGTIARGRDALEDAEAVRTLLNSVKDEAELTMCTDVDRNDKARICLPGSILVAGRRLVEMHSRLIHTADHVFGTLRPGMDGLDALLTHTWAVTVTGAPKRRAMAFIETHEKNPRRWYGGCFGKLGVDGSIDTGLTLRGMRLADGIAEVRVGATLLHDSDPDAEEAETRLKASALLTVLGANDTAGVAPPLATPAILPTASGPTVLLADCEDSFVLTLASYIAQAGARVRTVRPDVALAELQQQAPDLLVLSPGPGLPSDFPLARLLDLCAANRTPVFGVCLGLQALTEWAGGQLRCLPRPVHGKASLANLDTDEALFAGLPHRLAVGRYHSWIADRAKLPASLKIIAELDDGTPMALRHRTLPFTAVQFHPESILTAQNAHGLTLIRALVSLRWAQMRAVAA